MLTRREMRQLAQAARNGWETPIENRVEAVHQLREVLHSDAAPHLVKTALTVLNVMEVAGWVETADAGDVLQ